MNFETSIRKNLFVLNYEPEKKIIYAPLQGQAFFCGIQEAKEISEFINTGHSPSSKILCEYLKKIVKTDISLPSNTPSIDTKDRLVIILSQMCNMACTYCFAQESRSSRAIDETVLYKAIDYIFLQSDSLKVFTFIGGGEPIVTWNILKKGLEYIHKRSVESGIEYSARIITNGTLINRDIASFLAKFHVSVSLSFEILPDIQNIQRPLHIKKASSFEAVCKGIEFLRNFNIPFGFRSTITDNNVHRMQEMVEFSLRHFPEVSKLHFEPVTTDGLNMQFYHSYVKCFMDAFFTGDKSNVFVTNSFINSYFKIKNRFCQGEMCLTPTGELVACHRHSSNADLLFASFSFGVANTDSIFINRDKLNSVIASWNKKYKECDQCMAKWHCAGKCTSIRRSLSYEDNLIHCSFIRELLSNFIAYNLNH